MGLEYQVRKAARQNVTSAFKAAKKFYCYGKPKCVNNTNCTCYWRARVQANGLRESKETRLKALFEF